MNEPSSAEKARNAIREPGTQEEASPEIDLSWLLLELWSWRKVLFLAALISAGLGVAYAWLAKDWFRASTLLMPASQQSGVQIPSNIGSLAAIAGISVGSNGPHEAIAMISSRGFIGEFLREKALVDRILLALNGDDQDQQGPATEALRTGHAIDAFLESVLRISEDRDSPLITLSVDWIDPQEAADWSNTLVWRLNERLRLRAIQEANENIAFLQKKLKETGLVRVQQSISSVIEREFQRLMLAQGESEFALRVVDPAQPPHEPVRPRRGLLILTTTVSGLLLSIIVVIGVTLVRDH